MIAANRCNNEREDLRFDRRVCDGERIEIQPDAFVISRRADDARGRNDQIAPNTLRNMLMMMRNGKMSSAAATFGRMR